MKKLLSFFISVTLVALSFFCVPFTAKAAVYEPDTTIYADSYMLINLDDASYPVVAQKNQDKLKYPASLTKIITAMVAINNVDDIKATTTISKYAIESLYGSGAQVAGLKIGTEITVEDLLYLAMVHSACDACNVLAEYVAGSIDEFVKMMNEWVTRSAVKIPTLLIATDSTMKISIPPPPIWQRLLSRLLKAICS